MKQKKNVRPVGLGSGLSSLLGAEVDKNSDNYKMVPVELNLDHGNQEKL